MRSQELTDTNAKAASVGDVLWDRRVPGLHLKKLASCATFYLRYRTKAGAQRCPKIGRYGVLTVAQARDIARDMMADVGRGLDPAAVARAAPPAELTVNDLWAEYYKRHISKMRKSQATYLVSWRSHLEPRFGALPLSHVTYSRISDMMDDMAATPAAANSAHTLLRAMFNFAIAPLGLCEKNPCKAVRRYPEVKRRRYMKGEEAARVSERLHHYSTEYPAAVAFLYLLILTGARMSEVAAARWDWIRGNTIQFPDSKTGEKVVYLPPAAMDVLDRLPRTSGTITGLNEPRHLWKRIRVEAGCPDLRIHDLRHSFASAAISAGMTLAQIGGLLGHKSPQTTMRYAHLVEEAGVAAATATADQIMKNMKEPV